MEETSAKVFLLFQECLYNSSIPYLLLYHRQHLCCKIISCPTPCHTTSLSACICLHRKAILGMCLMRLSFVLMEQLGTRRALQLVHLLPQLETLHLLLQLLNTTWNYVLFHNLRLKSSAEQTPQTWGNLVFLVIQLMQKAGLVKILVELGLDLCIKSAESWSDYWICSDLAETGMHGVHYIEDKR